MQELADPQSLSCVSMNQKHSCLAIAQNSKYTVFSLKTGRPLSEQNVGKKILFCEMYDNSNMIILVFASERNKVFVWDDAKKAIATEFPSFPTDIVRLIVRMNYLSVWTQNGKLTVIDVKDFSIYAEVSLPFNSATIIDSPVKKETLIGWNKVLEGGKKRGGIVLWDIHSRELLEKQTVVAMHTREITLWAFDRNGQFFASAAKGNEIKIYCLGDNSHVTVKLSFFNYEFSQLSFSVDSALLAVVCKASSIHFVLNQKDQSKLLGSVDAPFQNYTAGWSATGELFLWSLTNKKIRISVITDKKFKPNVAEVSHLLYLPRASLSA